MLEKRVTLRQLCPGMYVSRLDRPWLGTPFSLQGFQIRVGSDIAELRKHCKYVFIDVERGLDAKPEKLDIPPPTLRTKPDPVEAQVELPKARQSAEQVSSELENHFGNKVYKTIVPRNVRLAEAPSYGKPVIAFDKNSKGAQAYCALAQEILERVAK